MATQTTNLHLKKPEYGDIRDIMDINDNMDTLDAAIVALGNARVSVDQGAANSGKFMVVNSEGNVVPTTVPFANGVSF